MSRATLTIATDPKGLPIATETGELVILPSSGEKVDAVARELLASRGGGVRVPSWRGPFDRESPRLDRAVVGARHLVAAVDLDRVGARGPFVLDLLARYVSPVDRARILASPDRMSHVARLNQRKRFERSVIRRRINDGAWIWIESDDVIAAELVCLALSETMIPGGRRISTPWEDDLVQRATELELGARYPGDIRFVAARDDVMPVVTDVLGALHLRTGIDISGLRAQY